MLSTLRSYLITYQAIKRGLGYTIGGGQCDAIASNNTISLEARVELAKQLVKRQEEGLGICSWNQREGALVSD